MVAGILSKEVAIYAVPLVTLLLGSLVGYLAQRSGFCSIGGFRDYYLFRHTRILSGFITLIISAFFGYLLFSFLTPDAMPHFFWSLTSNPLTPIAGAPAGLNSAAYLIFAAIPGVAIGFICTLLGGCPLRQTVMASEGSYRSGFFILGMGVGAIIFAAFVSGWTVTLMKMLGFGA